MAVWTFGRRTSDVASAWLDLWLALAVEHQGKAHLITLDQRISAPRSSERDGSTRCGCMLHLCNMLLYIYMCTA